MGSSSYEAPAVAKRASGGSHCSYRIGRDRCRSRFRRRVERVRPALCLRGLRDRLHRFGGDAIGGPFPSWRCGCVAMDAPRQVPFHESANRPNLLLGGDRELVLVFAILAAMLVFAVMKWWSVVAGVVLWLTAVGVLARMGKADPLLRQVYLRHIRYRAFYPAKSRLVAPQTTTPMGWR